MGMKLQTEEELNYESERLAHHRKVYQVWVNRWNDALSPKDETITPPIASEEPSEEIKAKDAEIVLEDEPILEDTTAETPEVENPLPELELKEEKETPVVEAIPKEEPPMKEDIFVKEESVKEKTPAFGTLEEPEEDPLAILDKVEIEEEPAVLVPDLTLHTFETFEEFRKRLEGYGYLFAGEVILDSSKYQITKALFPIEIKLQDWLGQIEKKDFARFLVMKRDDALKLFKAGKKVGETKTSHPLFVSLSVKGKKIVIKDNYIGKKRYTRILWATVWKQMIDWWRGLTSEWRMILQEAINFRAKQVTLLDLVKILSLKTLDCSAKRITSIMPIRHLQHLEHLKLSHSSVLSLKGAEYLRKLHRLDCSNTSLSNLQPIADLPKLRILNLYNTQVDSLRPIIAGRTHSTLNLLVLIGTYVASREAELLKSRNPYCEILATREEYMAWKNRR